jgi:hypothetical protein
LASAGQSLSEIAIEMQRSKNAIRDWAEKLNIESPNLINRDNGKWGWKPRGSNGSSSGWRRRKPDDRRLAMKKERELMKLAHEKHSAEQIAKKLDAQIFKVARRLGVDLGPEPPKLDRRRGPRAK